jgi:hypothetical protein
VVLRVKNSAFVDELERAGHHGGELVAVWHAVRIVCIYIRSVFNHAALDA